VEVSTSENACVQLVVPVTQLINRRLVLSQIQLGADQHYRRLRRMMGNLRIPLLMPVRTEYQRTELKRAALTFVLTFS